MIRVPPSHRQGR